MEELIKIENRDGISVVSARVLHSYLEVKTVFADWCKRMFEYGFEEDKDFISILGKSTGGRPSVDYALTMDTAKEISMLQRTEKGKEARHYFIECEKKQKAGLSRKDLALMVIQAEEEKERLILENSKLKPRYEFVSIVFEAKETVTMSQAAKLLKLKMGRNTLFRELRERGILFKGSREPKQEFINRGYFKLIEVSKEVNGKIEIYLQPLVTQKGLAYIAKLLGVIEVPEVKAKLIA